MSPLLVSLLAFAAAAGLLVITPGVDTAMLLRALTQAGPRGGASASVGICLGLLVWGVGAAFGLTAVLAASQLAYTFVKWAGAGYLLYLGVKLLLKPAPLWRLPRRRRRRARGSTRPRTLSAEGS